MRKLSSIGRADLAAALLGWPGLNASTAAALGYGGESTSPSDPADTQGGREFPPETAPVPRLVFPSERPRLRFLRAVESETFAADPEPAPRTVRPLRDDELLADPNAPEPAVPPLTPWRRLGPFLRSRLARTIPGQELDERTLTRTLADGVPLVQLPRRLRRAWTSRAVLLWDRSGEMRLFRADASHVLRRLRLEMGRSALTLRATDAQHWDADLRRLPPEAPVLLFSALGQLSGLVGTTRRWHDCALALRRRGHPTLALVPAPVDRWERSVAASWNAAVWDRWSRLPRLGSQRAKKGGGAGAEAVDRLLDLISVATRVTPALLRLARLQLGRSADVGTEWDAWHHPEVWRSQDACGLIPGPAYEARLRRRAEWQGERACAGQAVGSAMLAQHVGCSPLLGAEAVLRAALAGGNGPGEPGFAKAKLEMERAVERLRELAAARSPALADAAGLAVWFEGLVGRLSPELRQHPELGELVSRGLAWARLASGTFGDASWPHGIDPQQVSRSLAEFEAAPSHPADAHIYVRGASLVIAADPVSDPTSRAVPLARIHRARPWMHRASPELGNASLELASPAQPLGDWAAVSSLTLLTDRQRLHLAPLERPAWARRFWQDRFGLAAEFRVGEVPFVLRWIPPGRFRMGSPESERGRWDAEGPTHEVSITRGFWLGETPVTQRQWRAGVEQARKSALAKGLEPQPSHFEGPDDAPVESVSWDDCQSFLSALSGVVGLDIALPSEAQWEYACRAGTQAAFYDGSECTEPVGNDPALQKLGWFKANSSGRTQPVKGKAPNAWGLFDLLGNVWEWCLDGWNSYDEKPHIDPIALGNSGGRVVRGGAWSISARVCRAAYRDWGQPGFRGFSLGFRLAAGHELQPAEPGDRQGGAGVEGRDLQVPRRSRAGESEGTRA